MGKQETEIQNDIRAGISDICKIFRVNNFAGTTQSGNYVKTGVPKGYPDLQGFRRSDGRCVYIETKTPIGSASSEQLNFIESALECHCLAGFARSVDDARKIILDTPSE